MARKNVLSKLLEDKAGATAIEYGLILGLIAIVIFASLQGLSTSLMDMWNNTSTKVTEAVSGRG